MSRLRPARWLRPWLLATVIIGLLAAATAVTVQAVRRADGADRAAAETASWTGARQAESAGHLAEVDRLERDRLDAGQRRDRDRSDARTIDHSVARLAVMRTELRTAEAAIAGSQPTSDVLGGRLDVLRTCRQTLDAAARAYDTGAGATAPALLEAGRAVCETALGGGGSPNGSVHPYDFADPQVMVVGDTYFAYGTNGPAGDIQVLSSTDLVSWQVRGDALAGLAPWAQPGRTWAPAVASINGEYVLYYSVRDAASTRQCISAAVSSSPTGPFLDASPAPVVCQPELGGAIDPSPYRDELGFWHLSWKSEDETVNGRSKLWTQYLAVDGRSLVGPQQILLDADRGWDAGITENPSMAMIGDRWVLLYSGNRWDRPDYAMGYALCASATGPCLRPERSAALSTGPDAVGPGGGALFQRTDGRWMVAFAAWDTDRIGPPNSRRLHLAPVTLAGDRLTIG